MKRIANVFYDFCLLALFCLQPIENEAFSPTPIKSLPSAHSDSDARAITTTSAESTGRQSALVRAAVSVKHSSSASSAQKRGWRWHRRDLRRVGVGANVPAVQVHHEIHDEWRTGIASNLHSSTVASSFGADSSFILQGFHLKSPADVLPTQQHQRRRDHPDHDLAARNAILTDPQEEAASLTQTLKVANAAFKTRGSPTYRILQSQIQNILRNLLERWSMGSKSNFVVHCEPKSSLVKLLAMGYLRIDASVDFDRIAFKSIQMSAGRLEAKRLALNLWSFAPDRFPIAPKRYPNQFDFYARNVTFTQDDLFESSCIRNGLRRLLTRILKKVGTKPLAVTVDAIRILPTGKLSLQGQTVTSFGSCVPYEVRTGLGTSGRGHILTFPGLEIALGPTMGFFVPILPEITLDLGHNAQLLDLDLDGARSTFELSARVTITPEHTLKLQNYIQSSGSYAALCSVDVGRWITKIGRFTS